MMMSSGVELVSVLVGLVLVSVGLVLEKFIKVAPRVEERQVGLANDDVVWSRV